MLNLGGWGVCRQLPTFFYHEIPNGLGGIIALHCWSLEYSSFFTAPSSSSEVIPFPPKSMQKGGLWAWTLFLQTPSSGCTPVLNPTTQSPWRLPCPCWLPFSLLPQSLSLTIHLIMANSSPVVSQIHQLHQHFLENENPQHIRSTIDSDVLQDSRYGNMLILIK